MGPKHKEVFTEDEKYQTRIPTSTERFWKWTGIGEKTLLELLQFTATIIASIAIPITVAMLSNQQEKTAEVKKQGEEKAAEVKKQQEQKIAEDNQHHAIMSNYLDQMTYLLLDKQLRRSVPSSEVQLIARARTLNTLRRLDGERKGQLLKFLYEENLIGGQCHSNQKTLQADHCKGSILHLNDARLDETTFERPFPLQGIDLTQVTLAKARLPEIDLTKAEMQGAILNNANLAKALLKQAQMQRSQLRGTILVSSSLIETNLSKADLQGADLRSANLTGATLEGANLKEALYNDATKFPKGFNPASEGMRLKQ
jgi:uncharacterized protein YjbI with pentapeptide repeats